MKEVIVLRHADWDLETDRLTEQGMQRAINKAEGLPKFTLVYSSPYYRTQQSAQLASGRVPIVDILASTPGAPHKFRDEIQARRKIHPLGVAGALFEIPEVRPSLQVAGEALKQLIEKTLSELEENEYGLIVSHDGTMVAAERIIQGIPLGNPLDHTYGELEGYSVDQNLLLRQL